MRLASLTLALMAAAVAAGCDPASLSYFLFRGDGKAPAMYPLKAPEGKNEISVALMVAAPNAPLEIAGIDRDLNRMLGQILVEETKGKRNPIRVIDAAKIDRYKLSTPGWKAMSQVEIAKALGADYLIDARVTNLNLYAAGTGKLMYQGQASVEAVAYEAATGMELPYAVNPKLETKPSDSVPASQYRAQLVQRIAEEISWKHIPHISDRRVAPEQ